MKTSSFSEMIVGALLGAIVIAATSGVLFGLSDLAVLAWNRFIAHGDIAPIPSPIHSAIAWNVYVGGIALGAIVGGARMSQEG